MADKEKTEMVTEPEVVEAPKETPKGEPKADTESKPVVDVSAVETELEKTRDALKKANKEAAERRKRLEELEEAERKRAEAEMTEAEKRDARIKELETAKLALEQTLKQKEYAELQSSVAKAVAKEMELPFDRIEPLVSRLRGETEEELIKDAKAIFAVMPRQEAKPDTKLTPKIEPTNPANGVKGETMPQKKSRILGTRTNPFTSMDAAERGGGVIIVEKGE